MDDGLKEPQGFKETMKEKKGKLDNPGQGNDNSNKPETPPGLENKDKDDKGKSDS